MLKNAGNLCTCVLSINPHWGKTLNEAIAVLYDSDKQSDLLLSTSIILRKKLRLFRFLLRLYVVWVVWLILNLTCWVWLVFDFTRVLLLRFRSHVFWGVLCGYIFLSDYMCGVIWNACSFRSHNLCYEVSFSTSPPIFYCVVNFSISPPVLCS